MYVRVISWKIRICVKFSFLFFFNLKNGKQKLTIGFNFYILSKHTKMKNENICSVFFFRNVKTYVFIFFSGHRKMKKKNKTKQRKENVYLLLIFSEKWRIINLWSIFNFQFSMKTNSTDNVFLLFFVFRSVPRSSLAGTKQDGDNRESPWQRGWKGYCVIRD